MTDQLPARIRAEIIFQDAPTDRPVIGPCWIWNRGKTSSGYGVTRWFNGKPQYLHRIAYAVYVAAIPLGAQIDHRCRVRACCNPDHLDAVTPRVNTLRGIKATKTECVAGHPLSGDNLIWMSHGPDRPRTRKCRTCENRWQREHYERRGGYTAEQRARKAELQRGYRARRRDRAAAAAGLVGVGAE